MIPASRLALAGLLLAILVSAGAGASRPTPHALARPRAEERVRLVPHFATGDTARYQYDIRTETTTHTKGPIANPEAPSKLSLSLNSIVKLEVLSVDGNTPDSPGRVHLRTTYEKCAVESHSDAFDPQQEELEDSYKKLEGQSLEFTIEPDGRVTDVTGLGGSRPEESSRGVVDAWLAGMAQGSSAPREGIAVGQKWTAERPVDTAPLAGLVWRTESTFLREEPCPQIPSSASTGAAAKDSQDTCAIILTKFEMDDHKMPHDPTPDLYRRNGLRTAGKWTGSGESLSAVSIRTGRMVSVTQTGSEEMDVTISTTTGPQNIHYAGQIKTQSQITLVPESAAPSSR